MLIHKFVVPITLTLLVSLVMVKCQGFNLKNKLGNLGSDVQGGRSIQIELVLYNRCSRGNIQLEGKKVTAAPGNSSSKLVLTSVGMGSKLTIHSNGTFLCFNKGGRLVNKRRRSRRKSLCEFREIMRDNYSTFQSVYNDNWYIGFNSTGKPMRGRKVRPRRWFPFMFLKRRCKGGPLSPFDEVPQGEWLKLLNETRTDKS
ncbi:fibroblast growth factor 17-like [Dermacentor silvarum]|uniref:fibroblast growth factor 17-like n=1 Tax=Dermacentor silvarum TaxID=543639 RepID=UPI00189B1C2F|nr:fibroblast growth factor 17-like [Dermacentor silvarum]